jgi:hypothetical protein
MSDPMTAAPDPKTVREDDDAFCPHTAYPLQVTLTLIEGDMTVRHTECGRTVLTDWPYLRAHDMPLTLAYATDDQDEDWLELRLPAGLDEWLQEDEQQPADVVTAEQQQDGAAEDLRTFLAALPPRIDIVADWTRGGVRNVLTAEALRAVLAERDALAARVAELESEREADVRAVAAFQAASGQGINEIATAGWALVERFADRVAALAAQDEQQADDHDDEDAHTGDEAETCGACYRARRETEES